MFGVCGTQPSSVGALIKKQSAGIPRQEVDLITKALFVDDGGAVPRTASDRPGRVVLAGTDDEPTGIHPLDLHARLFAPGAELFHKVGRRVLGGVRDDHAIAKAFDPGFLAVRDSIGVRSLGSKFFGKRRWNPSHSSPTFQRLGLSLARGVLAKEFHDLFLQLGNPGPDFNEMPGSLNRIQDRSRDSAGDLLRVFNWHASVRGAMHHQRRDPDRLERQVNQRANLSQVVAETRLSALNGTKVPTKLSNHSS